MSSPKLYRLDYFEQATGPFQELTEKDGILVADLGSVHLALPSDLEQTLRPLLGHRITLLRTDIPQKEYIFRVLAEEPNHVNEI